MRDVTGGIVPYLHCSVRGNVGKRIQDAGDPVSWKLLRLKVGGVDAPGTVSPSVFHIQHSPTYQFVKYSAF